MALEIKWAPQADKGLERVLKYLEAEWTAKEILQLEEKINQVIVQISLNPDLYPKSESYKNLHKAIVDKNNYLVYRTNSKKSVVEIVNFRGTKQKPKY
ncbi:type II toxin-antitoxin system RelE/ParE family toxin [Flavobacterium sp.]|uniref:type II toxin-antitoxin system RelE/ParE family toxin n=1 Tax=Flavobacterium sp. TaxID=239 RepID=UPI00286D866E|nr:type II toxin-antitoxin system RelE/ParE family toxin [Flavobacterium sp.]